MPAPRSFLAVVVLALAVSACTPTPATPPPATSPRTSNIPWPRVVEPGWHRLGDQPEMSVIGFDRFTYADASDPASTVEIFFIGSKATPIDSPDGAPLRVMGQTVATYDSGNEDPAFATVPMRLTAPDGTSHFYMFQFNGRKLCDRRGIPRIMW